MKNKRQLKAEKSQRLAKSVAKKVAADTSTATIKIKSKNQPELTDTIQYNEDEKNKKTNKQVKRAKVEKDNIQTNASKTSVRKTDKKDSKVNNSGKMPTYDELPVQDLQRYLETLPSPEIRHFIEGLIMQDKFNMLPIDVVAAIGDMDRMKYYFLQDPVTRKSRYDPNGRCLDGGTPLHAAIKAKSKEAIQLLIENGADLSLVDFMGDNAIMAAIKAGVANMINILWPYKANLDVNHANTISQTALHLATERSWEGCVRFLLSNRACPDVKDRNHVTPLMLASEKGDLKIVDSLVKAGADVTIEDTSFNTAISKAMYKEHQPVLDCLLKSLDDGKRENYVKGLVSYVINPPLPEPEYAMLEARYVPLLIECTKYPEYRDSFYKQRIVSTIEMRMRHRARQFDSLMQMSCLLLNIFFRFGTEIDIPFVRQFFSNGFAKFILRSAQEQVSEFNMVNTLQVFFPMIGLAEIPEGRNWIWKNILDVSEYFNHFDKNQLTLYLRDEKIDWFLEKDNIKEIKRVWNHFHNEVNKMQTEHREKHMRELLQQEELDRCKKERRLEKIKQKREEKMKLQESIATSELMEAWFATCRPPSVEDEFSDNEEGFGTCRNANAIVGLSGESATASMASTDGTANHPDISSQTVDNSSNDSFQWAYFHHDPLTNQIQTATEDDWTTVQNKKNKDKDRHSTDRQTVLRQSPVQNSTRKKNATQKQKKKRESKPVHIPLNAFTSTFPAPTLGSARWADVAKGVPKSTSHVESRAKQFPLPKQVSSTSQNDMAIQSKQGKKHIDFPTLNQNQTQCDRTDKPNKMTFHFHSEVPDCDSDSQCGILDDSVDIEQAELELQEYEASTCSEKVSVYSEYIAGSSFRSSQASECFMCDPEYTDGNIGIAFDPTNLTEEEISSFNTRGKSPPAKELIKSDNLQSNLESEMEDLVSARKNTRKESYSNSRWIENIESVNTEEDQDNEVAEIMTTHSQSRNEVVLSNNWRRMDSHHPLPKQNPNMNGTAFNSQKSEHRRIPVGDIEGRYYVKDSTGATTDSINASNVKNADTDIDQRVNAHTAKTRTETSMFTDEATKQLIDHQSKSFPEFEEQLKHRESEHFIELIESAPSVSEPKTNIVDDLFDTPGEIPEWLNEEEEMPNEEDVWNEMTSHSTPVKELIDSQNKPLSQEYNNHTDDAVTVEGTHVESAPVQKAPCDLSVADPAIIRCSKKPDAIETTDENTSFKVYENTSLSIFQTTAHVPNELSSNNVSLTQTSQIHERLPTTEHITDVVHMINPSFVEKPAAVVKPLGLHNVSPTPVVNCAFGQKLLENACRLGNDDTKDDSVLYPDDLNGESFQADNEHGSKQTSIEEDFYFPSFHQETLLSAHHNENDISIAHRVQQVQLQQIADYYRRCNKQIADGTSMDHSRFLYFAQVAGMDKRLTEQYLQGQIKVEQAGVYKRANVNPTLPNKPGNVEIPDIKIQELKTHQNICDQTAPLLTNTHVVSVQNEVNQGYGNSEAQQIKQCMIQPQVPGVPMMSYPLLRPYLPPSTHPANIQNIQSQQTAMSSSVKMKITEMMEAMVKNKPKSVRWADELSMIRNLPNEKQFQIGKIVIPRDECDRVYIANHGTGPTILGYLIDGSEIAVKIMNSKLRLIKSDDLQKLLSVDSSQPFVNRYRAIEEFEDNYYLAMDLYEYSLPEYLHIIHKDEAIDERIAAEKLVFQMLRGFLALHQTYLILHAELRPENLVIDIDGTLKVAWYGVGRNTERAPERYIEYCDEDKCWLAPEVLLHRQPITFKMDIFVVGMVIYYIYKGGKNPFGSEPQEIMQNICTQTHMMDYISEEVGHLLSLMLSINKIERPAIAEALKHPLFWADEKKLRFVSIVGSDIVWELKHSFMLDKKQRDSSMTAIISMAPCNINLLRWMAAIEPAVMKQMKTFRQYKNILTDLVVFIFNCCNHYQTLSPKVREIIDEPCRYFLKKFPTLFMTVYRAIKFSNRKDKTCYKPFF